VVRRRLAAAERAPHDAPAAAAPARPPVRAVPVSSRGDALAANGDRTT